MEKTFSTTGLGDHESMLDFKLVNAHVSSFDIAGSGAEAKDSFDFKAAEAEPQAGLLLPAIQQVREPSPLPPDEADQFDFTSTPDGPAKGLLLPAVQKVHSDVYKEQYDVAEPTDDTQSSDPLPRETFSMNFEEVKFSSEDDAFVWG